MGGRGASSSGGGKYAGKFASGTDEQLQIATENLNNWINQQKKYTDNRKSYEMLMGKEQANEFLKEHEETLKELLLQKKELDKEKAKRKLK